MVGTITPEALAPQLRSGGEPILLLDVREDDERATARIEPSLHIPMNDVPARIAEIPRDRPIVVYCHSGVRSMMVAGYLEGEGFQHVSNLTGGIERWSARVDPSVPRY